MTLLAQPNQAGANIRITPFSTRFLGQSVFQTVKVAPFASAFVGVPNLPYNLAGQASQALNATAAFLDTGATQPLSDFIMAEKALVTAQLSPIPIIWTVEFDILIRAQVQVNGGDIALVL